MLIILIIECTLNIVSTNADTRVNRENVKGNQIEKDANNYQINLVVTSTDLTKISLDVRLVGVVLLLISEKSNAFKSDHIVFILSNIQSI